METLTDYPGLQAWERPARAVRLVLCDAHQFFTFADNCEHGEDHHMVRYGVIGTHYGWLHNTAGGYWLWKSPSSAYACAKAYREEYE